MNVNMFLKAHEVDGRSAVLAQKLNLSPINVRGMNAVLRWKEGQPLQLTAVAACTGKLKDVIIPPLYHSFTCLGCHYVQGGP